MALEYTSDLTALTLTLPANFGHLVISDQPQQGGVALYFKGSQLVTVVDPEVIAKQDIRIFTLLPSETFDINQISANIATLVNPTATVPAETALLLSSEYQMVLQNIFHWLSDQNSATIAKPSGKPRHYWRQEFATLPLYVDYHGSLATVFWQARNELRIVAGAKLQETIPLNKDGSLGFAAKFTQALRTQHAATIVDGVTSKDITLKSVNEIGHFLYFAGTNSWQILHTKIGETLDALSRGKNS